MSDSGGTGMIDTVGSGEPTPASESGDIPDAVLEALQGTVAAQSGDSDSEPAAEGDEVETVSLNTLAEAAGGPEQLYNMTLSLGDELGSATVEQIKDEAVAYRKGQAQRSQFESSQTEFANEKLRYQQELQQVVAALGPDAISDQKLAPVREFFHRQQAAEDQMLANVVPDWDSSKDAIGNYLASEYGAPTGVLELPAPAWVRKLIYDHHKLNERIKAVAERRKAPKAQKSAPANVAATDNAKAAVNQSRRGHNPVDAIAKLLIGN
jgi:hypothetical protein